MDVNDNEILEQGRSMKRRSHSMADCAGLKTRFRRDAPVQIRPSAPTVDANDVDALRLLLDTEQSKEIGDLWPDEDKRRELAKSIGCEAIVDGPPYPSMLLMAQQRAIDNYPYTPEVVDAMIRDIDRQAWNWTTRVWFTKYFPVLLLLIYSVTLL